MRQWSFDRQARGREACRWRITPEGAWIFKQSEIYAIILVRGWYVASSEWFVVREEDTGHRGKGDKWRKRREVGEGQGKMDRGFHGRGKFRIGYVKLRSTFCRRYHAGYVYGRGKFRIGYVKCAPRFAGRYHAGLRVWGRQISDRVREIALHVLPGVTTPGYVYGRGKFRIGYVKIALHVLPGVTTPGYVYGRGKFRIGYVKLRSTFAGRYHAGYVYGRGKFRIGT